MASSHGNIKYAKAEQIISEFFAKCLHIILESRSPYTSSRNYSGEQIVSSPSSSSSSSSSVRPRVKGFNLALRECPVNLDLYRQSNLEPMVVDVILVKRPLEWDPFSYSPKRDLVRNLSSKDWYPFCWNSDQYEAGYDSKREKIIERWVVQYESGRSRNCGAGNRRSSNTLQALFKKSILALRSLYVTVRLLPAYKIFQDLNSSGQIRSFTLTHKVSPFAEPFTREVETEMQQFGFRLLDTPYGRLCLSVVYRSSLMDLHSESSTPMSPQFIPDYVGSPLVDPLQRLPTFPHGSPSSLPFSRRHSWSIDHYKASPPSVSFSPSPTCSEPHASQGCPPVNLPPHPPETSSVHRKDTSYDEYYPSPNFNPSQSPSPPIRIPGISLSTAVLRSGSRSNSLDQNPHPFDLLDPGGPFPTRKSQDAAVGALILMLKEAPPLHHAFPGSIDSSQDSKRRIFEGNVKKYNRIPEPSLVQQPVSSSIASSGLVIPKTVADALEELRVYKEVMKDLLLAQANRSNVSANLPSMPKPTSSAATGT